MIDHQVLKYAYKKTKHKKQTSPGVWRTLIKEGETEYFEYLIKVEISKGWTPDGRYYQEDKKFNQPMLKYEGFVKSKPPPPPKEVEEEPDPPAGCFLTLFAVVLEIVIPAIIFFFIFAGLIWLFVSG